MQIPAGSKLYAQFGDQVVFALTGHTDAKPNLLFVRRKQANANGISGYLCRVVRGVTQADGSNENIVVTMEVRRVPNAVLADYTAAHGVVRSVAGSSNFDSDVGITSLLPGAADIAP